MFGISAGYDPVDCAMVWVQCPMLVQDGANAMMTPEKIQIVLPGLSAIGIPVVDLQYQFLCPLAVSV